MNLVRFSLGTSDTTEQLSSDMTKFPLGSNGLQMFYLFESGEQESDLMRDDTLLFTIAKLHFKEGLSQREVGNKLGLSRAKVNRLLQTAKDRGIVRGLCGWWLITCIQPKRCQT